jgi:hypothetical protein
MPNADEHGPSATDASGQPAPVKIAFVLYPGCTAGQPG